MENVFKSYYTKSEFIVRYMVSMLNPTKNDLILEPCGGDGIFIDSMLKQNGNLTIDTCDLNIEAVNLLVKKYKRKNNINVREADTLSDPLFDGYCINGYYDKIIGNPPYGGWQEYNKRAEFKKKYKGFYVKETYSLFLLRCTYMLKENGVLSFIVPDTFLFLNNHKKLREYLLTKTVISEIVIFPSKFFPNVAFGYSNLCIITLKKVNCSKLALNNQIRIITGLKKELDLDRIRNNEELYDLNITLIQQSEVYETADFTFLINSKANRNIIKNSSITIGDIADCVTGIYCGNNKKFLYVKKHTNKSMSDYQLAENNLIDYDCLSLNGVTKPYKYIPIIKGSSKTSYVRSSESWYIDWSENAISHYRTDKKARFQNSKFYFKTGIAMPMVKSSKIKATIIDRCVFDQSIVGIFPKEEKYLLFILAFMNSTIANEYIHTINPTANNSANYLKKIPIILPPDDQLKYIDKLVESVLINPDNMEFQNKLNEYFSNMFEKVAV